MMCRQDGYHDTQAVITAQHDQSWRDVVTARVSHALYALFHGLPHHLVR